MVRFQKTLGHTTSRRSSQHGFTLIELLTVMSLIGILSMLSISSFRVYRSEASNSLAKATVNSGAKAAEAGITSTEGSLPSVALYQQSSGGGISNASANQVLPGMILPEDVKLRVSHDPTCTDENCQSHFIQVSHCRGTKYTQYLRFGDGQSLMLDQPGIGCP